MPVLRISADRSPKDSNSMRFTEVRAYGKFFLLPLLFVSPPVANVIKRNKINIPNVIARVQLKIQTGVNDEKQHLLNINPLPNFVIGRVQLKNQTGVNDEKQHLLKINPLPDFVIASLRSNPEIPRPLVIAMSEAKK